ncbi:hypothetical protein KVT40_002765 [Elsinoe batatas]|uniref:Uncharacterized protein n=1 Tax=Elsinoe batatas TaxID=2601811 RepID=A0A8K0L7H3_9PEZI|nr:hypothetical protein KVT40_002765 [Elsinoe batatas]
MWRATTLCLQGLTRPLRIPCSIRPAVEPRERYCPGDYHPMHIGNYLNKDRYCVDHKLGWDISSTR